MTRRRCASSSSSRWSISGIASSWPSPGPAALEIWPAHREEIALLLTDLNLPETMNGAELAERLQAEKPALRVIYTSGVKVPPAASHLELVTGVNFLCKPFEGAKLAAAVRAMLDAPVQSKS